MLKRVCAFEGLTGEMTFSLLIF